MVRHILISVHMLVYHIIVTVYQSASCDISEDSNLLQHHRCGKLKISQ